VRLIRVSLIKSQIAQCTHALALKVVYGRAESPDPKILAWRNTDMVKEPAFSRALRQIETIA
jgi:hypothetical protein